jgi:Leucine-rich repeat (LRR) protein
MSKRSAPSTRSSKAKRAKHTVNIAPLTSLASIGKDCLGVIIDFLDTTHDWLQFSYTCKDINELKFAKEIMIRKKRTLRDTVKGSVFASHHLASLNAAKGTLFNVDFSGRVFVTDKFLEPLAGTIHTLDVSHIRRKTLTDEAFKHLAGIHTLKMSGCTKLTGEAFKYIKGVQYLDMSVCDQSTIKDMHFSHLAGIHTLNMYACSQRSITDNAFESLGGIQKLEISCCTQLSGTGFKHMGSLRSLELDTTNVREGFEYLGNLRTLSLSGCDVGDCAFECLTGLEELNISACEHLTDNAIKHLASLVKLDMHWCKTITDKAFQNLSQLRHLSMFDCDQTSITSGAFRNLTNLRHLDISGCTQDTITPEAFERMHNLETLTIYGPIPAAVRALETYPHLFHVTVKQ